MKILAIDTSGASASAAVADGAELIGEYTLNHGKTHSRLLMPMTDRLLTDAGLDISDMDLIAVSTGPGSFTGIRIGVAAAKGLAYALKKPLIGVNTLETLAYGIYAPSCVIVPMIDARNENVYAAAYECADGLTEIIKPCAVSVDELCGMLCGIDERRLLLVGDGAAAYGDKVREALGAAVECEPRYMNLPRAAALAARAYEIYSDGGEYPSYAVKPLYLKKSQAERELETHRNKSEVN